MKSWERMWTTEHSLFSVWLFGEELTRYTQEEIGAGLSEVYFVVEKDLATVYKNEQEHDTFNLFLAERSLNEENFSKLVVSKLQQIAEQIKAIIDLPDGSILKTSLIQQFIDLHHQLPAYSLTVTWAPDYFNSVAVSNLLREKTLKDYMRIRKENEDLYPSIERFIQKILRLIARETKREEKVLRALLPHELLTYLETKQLPTDQVLVERYGYSVLKSDLNGNHLYTNGQAREITASLERDQHLDAKELTGVTANKGKAEGTVKIIFHQKDLSKINPGDVLVTTMTRPEWVSAIKHASAIITDAGGILSHAAIVAREMKKPCIINTKIATQILKDGDLVEVDASKGIVRMLDV